MRYVEGRETLFQERLKDRPFWMLVCCQLVNLTSIEKAEPVLEYLMQHFFIYTLAKTPEERLYPILKPLGLHTRRAKSIVGLAKAWERHPPETAADVMNLPGCGQYAADSWKIFIEGDLDVQPDDGRLQWYLHRVKTEGEENGNKSDIKRED